MTFHDLIRSEFLAMGAADPTGWARQVTLDGPLDVQLSLVMVQGFELAIHELTATALERGALAQRDGHLMVRWRRIRSGEEPQLRVEWIEGGIVHSEPDDAPTGGHQLLQRIEQALREQPGATATVERSSEDLRCTIFVPLLVTPPGLDAHGSRFH